MRLRVGSVVALSACILSGAYFAAREPNVAVDPIISRISVGVFSVQGRREYQEDETIVDRDDNRVMVGVFDGHGGPLASHIAKLNISNVVKQVSSSSSMLWTSQSFWSSVFHSLEHLYSEALKNETSRQQRSSLRSQGREGTTACVATIGRSPSSSSNVILVSANAGDSRCVVCSREGNVVYSTQDHKPTDEEERKRAAHHGWDVRRGRLRRDGPNGVQGGLNLSRAIGDFLYGGAVPCEPDVDTVVLKGGETVVVATDGLWDVIGPEQACGMAVKKDVVVDETAKQMVQYAYNNMSQDNISCVVVRLPDAKM